MMVTTRVTVQVCPPPTSLPLRTPKHNAQQGLWRGTVANGKGQLLGLVLSGRPSPLILTMAGWHDHKPVYYTIQSNQCCSQETHREWKGFGEELSKGD